jgi:hypothetical protein
MDGNRIKRALRRRPPFAPEVANALLEHINKSQAEAEAEQQHSSIEDEVLRLKNFDDVRSWFMSEYETALRISLNHCHEFGRVEIRLAPLTGSVQKRFMGNFVKGMYRSKVYPAFHGTSAKNHKSICSRGLLIPGDNNELKVEHGAVHGPGVYTANVDAAWLSAGFCTEPRILICCVLDMGCVTFPGDAMVVSNSAHVVPLFEAIGSGKSDADLRAHLHQKIVAARERPLSDLSVKARKHVGKAQQKKGKMLPVMHLDQPTS